MFLKEVRKTTDMALVLPMSADEVITLDGLHPDGLVWLLEALFPSLSPTLADALCLCCFRTDTADGAAPGVAFGVVIAVYEEL